MKAKRLLAVLMCCLTACTMVACGNNRGDDEDPIDPTKTQLYVSNYDGGFGDEWLRALADRFEELHKDDRLEGGKTGIQVRLVNAKKQGNQILDEMLTSTAEVFFTEGLPYRDGALQDYFLDITDAVTTPLTEYGETDSIESKMTEQQQNWFKVNGKYYAIPHYEGYYGMFYDIDTFDTRNLFMTDTGTFTNYAGRGKGADGVAGTYDDGLPVNMTQFFKLLDEMKRQGMVAIGWPGANPRYMSDMLVNYSAAYEGYAQTMLNYTFKGSAENLITLSGSTVVEDAEALPINESNGYELRRQAGKYYALEFAERIIDGNYYSSGSFNQTSDYLDSQTKYLTSAFENNGAKEIGILIDGTWWENEASSIFESMAKRYPGSGKGERRFGIMPFPMPDGEESRSQSSAVVEHLMSAAFINKNIADYKKDLAIDFIRFCATDESLIEFTKITSAPKAFQYDLTTQLSELTYFGQQVWSFKQNSKVVYKFSDTPLYYMNTNYFQNNNWESGIQTVPSVALEEGMSSEDYFTGMYSTAKTSWANLIQ